MHWLNKFIDRIFIVLGVLGALQIPLFISHYELNLNARCSELAWQVGQMEKNAASSGKNINSYITKFEANPDRDFASQGSVMRKVYERWLSFSRTLQFLKDSTVLTKPFKFIFTLKWEVMKSTADSFTPGIPLTLEGACFALVGLFMGIGLYKIFYYVSSKLLQLIPRSDLK